MTRSGTPTADKVLQYLFIEGFLSLSLPSQEWAASSMLACMICDDWDAGEGHIHPPTLRPPTHTLPALTCCCF